MLLQALHAEIEIRNLTLQVTLLVQKGVGDVVPTPLHPCGVNVSVTGVIFVLYLVDLKTEHLLGYDCRNSGHKIADQELLMELYWPYIFPGLMHVIHLK